MSSNHLPFSAN